MSELFIPSAPPALITESVIVTREEIAAPNIKGRRRHLGNLQQLGQSLDKRQTTPMIATIGAGGQRLIHDGIRRLISADRGFAPLFTKKNQYNLLIVKKRNGETPHPKEVTQYCAVSKFSRDNWTYLDEALFYEQQILDSLKAIAPPSLKEERAWRAKIIENLATTNQVTSRTIRNRLTFLQLPPIVQDQLARGNLRADAALRLKDFTDQEALQILIRASRIDGVELARCLMPGDLHAKKVLTSTTEILEHGIPIIRKQTLERAIDEAYCANEIYIKGKIRPEIEIRRAISELNDTIGNEEQNSTILQTLQWTIYENQNLPTPKKN